MGREGGLFLRLRGGGGGLFEERETVAGRRKGR